MAGDWIKMQGNLWTSPKVVRLMSACKADKCRIVGGLFRYWCLFDEHTEDGLLEGYTKFLIDDELRIDGFADALEEIGWLIEIEGVGLQVPDFDDHMSKSAKRRAQETKRKRDARKTSASKADKNGTREEKRREEKNKDKSTIARFKKPTIEEITEYCQSRNNGIDAETFFHNYETKGWKVNGSPMKNWKSAVITWEKRDAKLPTKPQAQGNVETAVRWANS